jgi:hypothetical protein
VPAVEIVGQPHQQNAIGQPAGHRQRSGHQQSSHGRRSRSGESRRLALAQGCHGRELARATTWHHVKPLAQVATPPGQTGGSPAMLRPTSSAATAGGHGRARATGHQRRRHQVNRQGTGHAQAHGYQQRRHRQAVTVGRGPRVASRAPGHAGDVAGTGSGHDLAHQQRSNATRSTGHAQAHQQRSHGRRSRSGEGYHLAPRRATGSGGDATRSTGPRSGHQQRSHGKWSRSGEGHRLTPHRGTRSGHDLAHQVNRQGTGPPPGTMSGRWLRWRSGEGHGPRTDAPEAQPRQAVTVG